MKALHGVPAIRMAALMYARHGKTLDELVAFLKERLKVTRREVVSHATEAGVWLEDGRLCIAENVEPFWRSLPVWLEDESRGAA